MGPLLIAGVGNLVIADMQQFPLCRDRPAAARARVAVYNPRRADAIAFWFPPGG